MALHSRPIRSGTLDLTVDLESPGLPLGVTRTGRPLRLPLLAPGQTRVGVLGLPQLARLLAFRLLGAGCELTVVTSDPSSWEGVARAGASSPVYVIERLNRWPAENSWAPRALVVDMPEPPRPEFARQQWTTVVHVASSIDARSPWWLSAQVLLAGPGSQATVGALRPSLDVRTVGALDDITPPVFGAVVRNEVHLARFAPEGAERAAIA